MIEVAITRDDLDLLINTAILMRTEITREREMTLFPFLRALASERIVELTHIIEKADRVLHPEPTDGFHSDLLSRVEEALHPDEQTRAS